MITKYLKGLLLVLLFIPVLIKAQEKEKQEPPTQKEEYAKRIDKLAIGPTYTIYPDTFDHYNANINASLEMRYGSILAITNNFTIGYRHYYFKSPKEEQTQTVSLAYTFGIRLYAWDYLFFQGGLGLESDYLISSNNKNVKNELFLFNVNTFMGLGLNIPISHTMSLLLEANLMMNTLDMDIIGVGEYFGVIAINASIQFKV